MFHLESQESKRILVFASGNRRPPPEMRRLNEPLFGMAFCVYSQLPRLLNKIWGSTNLGAQKTREIVNENVHTAPTEVIMSVKVLTFMNYFAL